MKISGLLLFFALVFSPVAQASIEQWRQSYSEALNNRFKRNFAAAELSANRSLKLADGLPPPQVSANKYRFESMSLLGAINEDQAKYATAVEWYSKALELAEVSVGKDSEFVVTTLNNVARIHLAQKNIDQAIAMYERELGIRKRLHGDNSPRLTAALIKIARSQEEFKRYEKSERNYLQAVAIMEKNGGVKNPSLRPIFESLAKICEATGRKTEATTYAKRAAALPD